MAKHKLTTVKKVFLLISLLPLIYLIYCTCTLLDSDRTERMQQVFTKMKDFVFCNIYTRHRQVVQHGEYWVVRNFVHDHFSPCEPQPSLTMQGTYKDIIKLEALLTAPNDEKYAISFAAYIPDQEHMERTLEASAYIKNCIKLGASMHSVNIHLYVRRDQLKFSLNRDIAEIRRPCELNTTAWNIDNEAKKINTVNYANDHAEIVGRNIAHKAAVNKYILNINPDIYLSDHFYVTFIAEYTQCFNLWGDIMEKTFMRPPTFQVEANLSVILQASHHKKSLLQVSRTYSLINDTQFKKAIYPMPLATWKTVNEVECSSRIELDTQYRPIKAVDKYLLGRRADFPLLPEFKNLTVEESESLRFHSLALQGFEMLVLMNVFLLENSTLIEDASERFSVSEVIKPQPILDAILKEYEILYL